MNSFNEHQKRLWESMIDSIDAYKNNNINFSELVSKLEAAMQVGEFKDQELVKKWYDFWGALETHNAVSVAQSKEVIKGNVMKNAEAMRKFLVTATLQVS